MFSPNLGCGPARLLLTEPLQELKHREGKGDLGLWRIKRCGNDTRLSQEPVPFEEFLAENHISTTWMFPTNLFLLTKKGEITKADMDKKEMKKVKVDDRLKGLLTPPLPPNIFIKSHSDGGLILVMPTIVVMIKLQPGLVTSLGVLHEISFTVDCCNFYEFSTFNKFISWTPQVTTNQTTVVRSPYNCCLIG